ncbi:hypothetical protein [Alkalihalobacterium elongatum]|uniref:hypothetical protein n=1 Tax=Alkalihalobacterium elongatum TaxID=2675466 RepID=UPI001C1FF035|nr:hypothetical protein [Alkalihalobacterium elongatum]
MMHYFTVQSKVNEHKYKVDQINKTSWRQKEGTKQHKSSSLPLVRFALAALLNRRS